MKEPCVKFTINVWRIEILFVILLCKFYTAK